METAKISHVLEFLKGTLDSIAAYVAVLDSAGEIVLVNESWCKLADRYGVSRQACGPGVNYLDICCNANGLQAEGGVEASEGIAAVLAGESPLYVLEYPCHSPTEEHWFEMRVSPLQHDDRIWAVVAHMEVTPRKVAEEALRESRRMLRLILDTIPVRVFWKDMDLVYQGCNQLFAEDAGLDSPEQIVGMTDLDTPWPGQAVRYRADDKRVIETGRPKLNFEEPQTNPAGERIWLSTTKVPLRDPKGAVVGVLGTYEEITERKRIERERRELEAQFQHAQKLESLGVLAGGVAHDFNNLLVAILGNADLALADLSPTSPAAASLGEIRKASIRAAELTNQMLAFSGKGQFVLENLDLNELVKNMAPLLEAAISKKISLEIRCAEEATMIEADRAQIRQALMNIVTNASDAIGDEAGTITIRIGVTAVSRTDLADPRFHLDLAEGVYAFLEVVDTGCGIEAEAKERLFEPFYSTKFSGRGLGLAAVQGIVRGHRGTILVDSEPGQGATFTVLLPVAVKGGESVPVEADSEPVDDWRGAGTVLVVDDEPAVLLVAKTILVRAGFDVLTAVDGAEGVDVYRRNADSIVAVLLDLTMPNMNGEEAFWRMREIRPDVKVVLASGYSEMDASARFGKEGLAGFVQKPFRMNTLLQKFRSVLA